MENPLTRIGSHTTGAISDALQNTLLNGWPYHFQTKVTQIIDIHYESSEVQWNSN